MENVGTSLDKTIQSGKYVIRVVSPFNNGYCKRADTLLLLARFTICVSLPYTLCNTRKWTFLETQIQIQNNLGIPAPKHSAFGGKALKNYLKIPHSSDKERDRLIIERKACVQVRKESAST